MTYTRTVRKPYQPPKKRKPLERVGKVTGTVRKYGAVRDRLRDECYQRANGFCQLRLVCNGDYVPLKDGHMAHRKSIGSGGQDTKSNVDWSCARCHIQSHAYGVSKSKPVPRKEA